MRQHAIESIDRETHHASFSLPPSFISTQNPYRARVFTLATRDGEQLGERGRIEQPKVHSLSRERMNNVSRVTN